MALSIAADGRKMSLQILKKKINNVVLDYILSLHLVIAFVGLFLKLLMEVTEAGIFKF